MSLFATPGDAPAPSGKEARLASRYDRRRARMDARDREASKAGRDIGDLPAVAKPRRKAAARKSFRRFCEAYLPQTFTLKWSPDHLRVIERIEDAVLRGGLFAFAMPRSSGKSSLVETAALWSILYGHRDFVAVVGADENHAQKMLDSIWNEIEQNDTLADDFPEVCYPVRKLERIRQRSHGQLHHGRPTMMARTQSEIVLPTIAGSAASGAVLRAAGITGGIRGMSAKRSNGEKFRPSLALVDDPQTDQVAASPTQVAARLEVMRGAILGLAGPGKTIAGFATVTVIRPGDLADQILDRDRHPEWQGERMKLVYEWPTRDELWQQYAELRRDGQRAGIGVEQATAFYRKHRADMDAGARVAWPQRFSPDELSAIQHAWNLRLDRGEHAFASEFQNAPLKQALEAPALDRAVIAERIISLERGIVPMRHARVTIGVDVQERLLYWVVVSWTDNLTAHVLAYGTQPDQTAAHFHAQTAGRTLADAYPGSGFEAALLSGLNDLADRLLLREWPREDGGAIRAERMLVDANWGASTPTIREFARRHKAAAVILPAHGRGVGASSRPFNDVPKKAGEQVGLGWRVSMIANQRGITWDTNYWKSLVAKRLQVATGDSGCVTIHAGQHDQLLDHLTSEYPVPTEARGRKVDEWKLLPARENHHLDCLLMAYVAASTLGITADGAEITMKVRKRVEIPRPGERRVLRVRPR